MLPINKDLHTFVHRHRPDLDGIRGILACCVVLLHFGLNTFLQQVTHGAIRGFVFQLGVDAFFLLSGFVLAGSCAKSADRDWRGFAIKRILRLVPVFYITTAMAMVYRRSDYGLAQIMAEPFLATPLTLHDPANYPAWSITWELYLPIWAYAVAPWLPNLSRWGRWLALAVTLTALGILDVAVAGGAAYYFLRAALGLMGGAMLYRQGLPSWIAPAPWHTQTLLCLLIMLMLVACPFPHVAILAPFLICLMIASGAGHDSPVLSSRPARWLGSISYTFYLVHVPVLKAAQFLIGNRIHGNWSVKLACLAVSFMLAAALTSWVEAPMMRLSQAIARKRPVVHAGLELERT